MTRAMVPVRVWKEVRGLTPAWLASAALMVAAGFGDRLRAAGLLGYLLGAVALGALSMGHEYNGRTLTLLLSQPDRREMLFLRKFGVLSTMLLTLAAVAWVGFLAPDSMTGTALALPDNWRSLAFGLPLVCGLFLAPWLTMVCRNALAGIVFAIAVTGAVWLGSEMTSTFVYGGELSTLPEAMALTFDVFWRAILIVSAFAAVSTWWMFMRLEAIESRGLEVHLPVWLSGRMRASDVEEVRQPLWLLVGKELRLQQLTFAVAGLYLFGWFGLTLFGDWLPQPMYRTFMMTALTYLHMGAIALLAGSLASAEERNLGTLGWQVLLPVPAWQQWAVKTVVALGLALGLGMGLPAVVSALTASPELLAEMGPFVSSTKALIVIVVTVISLYVSTLSGNGLRAVLISLPVAVGVIGLASSLLRDNLYGQFGMGLVTQPRWYRELFGTTEIVLWRLLSVLLVVLFAGFLGLLLRFGMTNHRSAERGARRVWTQLAWMGGATIVGVVAWYGLFSVYADRVELLAQERNRQANATIARASFVVGTDAAVSREVVVIIFENMEQVPETKRAFARTHWVLLPDVRGQFNTWRMGLSVSQSITGLRAAAVVRPGTSAKALWKELDSTPALREPLQKVAVPFDLRAGETTTVTLTPAQLP